MLLSNNQRILISDCTHLPDGLPLGEVWLEAGLSFGKLDVGLLIGEVDVGLPGERGEPGTGDVLCPVDLLPGEGLHARTDAVPSRLTSKDRDVNTGHAG